jgi:hypothetical protein
VPLTLQQLCQKRASRPCPQYEDSHAVEKLYHTPDGGQEKREGAKRLPE